MLSQADMERIFAILKENATRVRSSITAVFLEVTGPSGTHPAEVEQIESEISRFLQSTVRDSDVVSKLAEPYKWCILLSHSGEEEARAFVRRLRMAMEDKRNPAAPRGDAGFFVGAVEIRNGAATFAQLLECGNQALLKAAEHHAWHVEAVDTFKVPEISTVRVSILEDNEIFRDVLETSLNHLSVAHFDLEVRTFADGHAFIESGWYKSGHTHLVIMNDILPRKNGIEVLHHLRKLPNARKFLIIMMTRRKSDGEMIYAYENGVDEYIIKPFHFRLFEAKIKRMLDRLWL